jgi:creatinine amidohydrolase
VPRVHCSVILSVAVCVFCARSAESQVLRVTDLTATRIASLDRARTVVILPGGILEQHAGHLPAYSDGFMNQHMADSLANAIAARPGWTALMFPMIPLGSGGANEIGGKYSWPGTYAVRVSTLRAIFMDLACELGEQGFRWVFVVHNHGSPWHNQALDDAGDFFRDTYGGRMVHLTGIEPDWSKLAAARKGLVTPQMLAEDAASVHAGLSETSRVMYVRPDLVDTEALASTPSVTTPMPELLSSARKPGWPGYFGAPRHASAALGKSDQEAATREFIRIAMQILDGADERSMKRYADMMLAIPDIQAIGEGSRKHDEAVAAKQEAWLSKRRR